MLGTFCSEEKYEITTETECKRASELLGLQWAAEYNEANQFPACFYADDGRNLVYFNLSPNQSRINVHGNYSAICRTDNGKSTLSQMIINYIHTKLRNI